MTGTYNYLLEKYSDIIKEEVNVKEISSLSDNLKIKKIYKPLGSKISSKFTKDTAKVIQFSKQGNIKELENGEIKVFDNDNNERILNTEDYEIAYEGLEGTNMAVDGNIIAKLDLEITPQLQKEGVAREISRFLNQMRKEADYKVDTKVKMIYETQNNELIDIIKEFSEFLKGKALLKEIEKSEKRPEGDVFALFTNDEESSINFALKQ